MEYHRLHILGCAILFPVRLLSAGDNSRHDTGVRCGSRGVAHRFIHRYNCDGIVVSMARSASVFSQSFSVSCVSIQLHRPHHIRSSISGECLSDC
ncbi:MAG: hypothetical protein J3Q66DRAFT_321681 [Benniella sp.]|nr:MAG: hypothetical protein J3Q66DRAFT_321681 [Benniella sp.]